MLENIKLMLGIEDNSKDELINLYISKISQKVMNYCNIKELPKELNGFVEDKVVTFMQVKESGNVKSITRGDTTISYNVVTGDNGLTLLDSDKTQLNRFRRCLLW